MEVVAKDFSLTKLLHLSEGFYRNRVEPLMYNYIGRGKIWMFQRNAAVAIGNSGDRSYVPELIKEAAHPVETVRAHVAWALGRIGGPKAKAALVAMQSKENGECARVEIDMALKSCSN